jgi:hypothetical protein
MEKLKVPEAVGVPLMLPVLGLIGPNPVGNVPEVDHV